jgi:hypothetical protein
MWDFWWAKWCGGRFFSFSEPRHAHLSSAGTGEIGPIVPGGPIVQIERKFHHLITEIIMIEESFN